MELNLTKNVRICEVGPRDGIQNEKAYPTIKQKINLIDAISEAGFPVIEVGSFVSPKAVPQMEDTDEVFRGITRKKGVEYRALVANAKGVSRAIDCGCQKVKLNVSASVSHNLANLNCTPEESVSRFSESVSMARGAGIGISGSISMAFGSPWDKEIPVSAVKKIVESYLNVGIDEISLSDASGMAYPTQVFSICSEMLKAYPQVHWWLHFHNTRGLGLANIMAAIQAGFNQFDSSFAGVGGCPFVPGAAGNVATEDLVHMLQECGIETGIDLDKVLAIGREITKIIGHKTDSFLLRAGKASDLIREIPKEQGKNHAVSLK